ncbi:hypothetical protein IB279_34370 [Ensifer sp. ENS06]|uniref:hypothetical protein n=1 Tax=Ensifer sp. ENS06 TaxID=2769276 RepID=UPI00177E5FC0|nr:hypothetical protein [Ensifer sp. ENS06]MBD9628038.1 hypothetical protein [Ensifer sp. ENS06]
MIDPSNQRTNRTTFEQDAEIDTTKHRADKNIEDALLGAMLHCEGRGDYPTLRGHVRYHGMLLAASQDTRILNSFVMLLVRAIEPWNYEAKYGEGSLLSRTSSANIEWGVLDAEESPSQS